MPANTDKIIEYFAQFGPWVLLFVLLLAAVCWASWKINSRMATALDTMHTETVKMSEKHSEEIKSRDDRIMMVVENNTKAFAIVAERLTNVDNRLSDVEATLEKVRG